MRDALGFRDVVDGLEVEVLKGVSEAGENRQLLKRQDLVPHLRRQPIMRDRAQIVDLCQGASQQEAQLLQVDAALRCEDLERQREGEQHLVRLEQAAAHGLVERVREVRDEVLQPVNI